jgi:hypothetical protein
MEATRTLTLKDLEYFLRVSMVEFYIKSHDKADEYYTISCMKLIPLWIESIHSVENKAAPLTTRMSRLLDSLDRF